MRIFTAVKQEKTAQDFKAQVFYEQLQFEKNCEKTVHPLNSSIKVYRQSGIQKPAIKYKRAIPVRFTARFVHLVRPKKKPDSSASVTIKYGMLQQN